MTTDPFRTSGDPGFDAGKMARRLKAFRPSSDHVNVMVAKAGATMLARARYLVRNNGYASNAVEAFASHSIGTGIRPNPVRTIPTDTRTALLEAWRFWTDEADADGLTDFYGLQDRIAREGFIAGEVFVRFRVRRPEDGLTVPLQLQVLPAEMLDPTYDFDFGNGIVIRNGIELDAIGRRRAYWFWRNHPGERPSPGTTNNERVRVPASEILHVYRATEAGQLRGISRFAPALVKLFSLDVYDDAELARKQTAAMFAGFVRNVNPEAFPEDGDAEDEEGGLLPLEPGLMQYLDPGEDVTFSAPADVGSNYDVFQYRTLLQVSSALGIPYPYLTGDMTKANYSNTRAALVDFRRRIEGYQWSVFVFAFCRPVWMRWLRLAQLSGAVSLPGFATREREYAYAEWLPPKMEWVDPLKDAKAEIEQIAAGLKSRSQAIIERGYDPEQVDEEIAADREREKRLGISFVSTSGAPPAGNPEDADPPPPNEGTA